MSCRYTKSNAAFAKSIEPKNQHLLGLIDVCASKDSGVITTGKYTIGDEKCVTSSILYQIFDVENPLKMDYLMTCESVTCALFFLGNLTRS
jgi:hypothetical protein